MITEVSLHLVVILYGPVNILLGNKTGLTVITDKSVKSVFQELYASHWASLLIMPMSILSLTCLL